MQLDDPRSSDTQRLQDQSQRRIHAKTQSKFDADYTTRVTIHKPRVATLRWMAALPWSGWQASVEYAEEINVRMLSGPDSAKETLSREAQFIREDMHKPLRDIILIPSNDVCAYSMSLNCHLRDCRRYSPCLQEGLVVIWFFDLSIY